MKRFPKSPKRVCPYDDTPLEPDEEYIYSLHGENNTIPLKDYPWACPLCERVFHWDDEQGWVE